MRRTRDLALIYLAAALSGLAAAYVLRQWTHRLDPDDKKPDVDDEAPPDTGRDPPASQTKSLPPLRTHSLPPPLPNAHAILSGSGGEDAVNEEGANTSDSDSFIDLLSPAPTHVISRRRSMRAVHDPFAESHISFAELGSLVAPQDESK